MSVTLGLLSTYPPTQCGLATFTAALHTQLSCVDNQVEVVRVLDRPEPFSRPEVVHHLVNGIQGTVREAVGVLNAFDVAIIQHEYGIYGGPDGEEILGLLDALTVPTIVVLHTVLVTPTPRQRSILTAVARGADAVVTMTRTARHRLVDGYGIDPAKVVVIPHGAADYRDSGGTVVTGGRPTILTWGLLGPGKGIEWAIDALAGLRDIEPLPRYLVVGQTHPRVLARDGETYRDALVARARARGVSDLVEFDATYVDLASLGRLVRKADVVLLPYDSREQVTSGVLIEAVTAGRPVVSTSFPHAVELLGGGAGLVVPQQDPAALASALRRVLTEPGLAARMSGAATRLAPQLVWPAVAQRYRDLAQKLVAAAVDAAA